ncbi:MAG: NAD(P)-dependent alcohol dehydrogenase [Flavobacteriaceae bacterium]|nr:NAD(P)-dependent alcohol dehydrogenase [Flavobacteriaceae bacterium]
MNAVVCNSYGGPEVLELNEILIPIPKENEVLVKIKATSVTAAHCAMREGKPYFGRLFLGMMRPKTKTPGTDLSGEIIKIGSKVKNFSIGDEIIAETGIESGCYAEYICLPEDGIIVLKPNNMSFEQATGMIDGASTAMAFFMDHTDIKKGNKILINGASGSIGTAAVQLAKLYGAEVTGVCSTSNIDMVYGLGADKVIDYTQENFVSNKDKYDIIFDTVGKLSYSQTKTSLYEKGLFLSPVLSLSVLFQMMKTSVLGSRKVKFAATGLRGENVRKRDLISIKNLAEQGKLTTVIDRQYELSQIKEAHEYVSKGHKKGNVVIIPVESPSVIYK